MLTEERYEKILTRLKERQSVTVNELADAFSVSTETIRRDLVFLESKNKLKRVFGGAVQGGGITRFSDFSVRMIENKDKKTEVCKTAAKMINEGDILAVSAGSTATVFADVLRDRFDKLTIITMCLNVFERLKDKFNVILSGGEYYGEEHMFYGELALSTIGRLHADKCFIFPSAITLEHGIEGYIPLLVPLQKKLMEISDRVMILADSTKYGKRALIKLTDASPDYVFVTDGGLDAELYERYAKELCIVKEDNENE